MTGAEARLDRSFFARPTLEVAPDLVGRTLYRRTPEGVVAGRLVEVEAYCGAADPASHAYRGPTRRNATMFGPPGFLYVYFTYGMHHCCNVVTEDDGVAGAVLLRAAEPVQGHQIMTARRNTTRTGLLARGPGRLCQAFALTLAEDGSDLTGDEIWLGAGRRLEAPIATSGRIGIRLARDRPWRFFEPGPWASGPRSPAGPPVPIG